MGQRDASVDRAIEQTKADIQELGKTSEQAGTVTPGQSPSATGKQKSQSENVGQLEVNFTEGVFTEGDLQIPYVDVSGRLFHTGKHRGIDYTEQRLDEMVNNFAEPAGELDWDVPVQLDHSDSAKDTVGHVRKLWRKAGDLMGTFRFVGQEAVKNVKQRLWKKLSAGIRLGPTFSVKEASVTPFPFLKSAKLFKEQTINNEEVRTMEPNEAAKLAEQAKTNPQADGGAQGADQKHSDDAKTAADDAGKKDEKKPFPPKPKDEEEKKEDAMSDSIKAEVARQIAAEQAAFNERTKKLEEQFAEREAKLKAAEEVARFKDLTLKAERFCETGKSVPAMREAELDLVKSFSDEQLASYEKLKGLQPNVVDFSVLGVQTTTERAGAQPSDADMQKFAEEQAPPGAVTVPAQKK